MKTTRTARFQGHEYNFIAYEESDLRAMPGTDWMKGFTDHLDGAAHSTWWTFEDEAVVRDRHWHFKAQDVVIDCGAALGSYTLTAAVQGAIVVALEPLIFCRWILQDNIRANPSLPYDPMVLPIGVHERAGHFEPEKAVLFDKFEEHTLIVKPLDETVFGLQLARVDMIKLDVEGAELAALKGAEKTIVTYKPRLLIEEHEFKAPGIGAECEALLKSWGYAAPERHNHGSVNHAHYVP
jgi:FkbM family methyltransferase